jgi:hypothetical protein
MIALSQLLPGKISQLSLQTGSHIYYQGLSPHKLRKIICTTSLSIGQDVVNMMQLSWLRGQCLKIREIWLIKRRPGWRQVTNSYTALVTLLREGSDILHSALSNQKIKIGLPSTLWGELKISS